MALPTEVFVRYLTVVLSCTSAETKVKMFAHRELRTLMVYRRDTGNMKVLLLRLRRLQQLWKKKVPCMPISCLYHEMCMTTCNAMLSALVVYVACWLSLSPSPVCDILSNPLSSAF